MAPQTRSNHRSTKNTKLRHDGQASVFTCPDCQGTLFILRDRGLVRFKCRIGHLYSPESMMEAQDDNVERLMWSAARALEEQAEYVNQMAGQVAKAADPAQVRQYRAKSRAAQKKSGELRKLLSLNADCPPAGKTSSSSNR